MKRAKLSLNNSSRRHTLFFIVSFNFTYDLIFSCKISQLSDYKLNTFALSRFEFLGVGLDFRGDKYKPSGMK